VSVFAADLPFILKCIILLSCRESVSGVFSFFILKLVDIILIVFTVYVSVGDCTCVQTLSFGRGFAVSVALVVLPVISGILSIFINIAKHLMIFPVTLLIVPHVSQFFTFVGLYCKIL